MERPRYGYGVGGGVGYGFYSERLTLLGKLCVVVPLIIANVIFAKIPVGRFRDKVQH